MAAVGIGGERLTLFYAEVTDEMKVEGAGGGLAEEGELIEVVEMSIEEVENFVKKTDVVTTPHTLYGIMWFLANKKK